MELEQRTESRIRVERPSVRLANGELGQIPSNTAKLTTQRGAIRFKPISDAEFVWCRVDLERAGPFVVNPQLRPIDERSIE